MGREFWGDCLRIKLCGFFQIWLKLSFGKAEEYFIIIKSQAKAIRMHLVELAKCTLTTYWFYLKLSLKGEERERNICGCTRRVWHDSRVVCAVRTSPWGPHIPKGCSACPPPPASQPCCPDSGFAPWAVGNEISKFKLVLRR